MDMTDDIYSLFERIESALDNLKSENNRGMINDGWSLIQLIKQDIEKLRSYDWAVLELQEDTRPEGVDVVDFLVWHDEVITENGCRISDTQYKKKFWGRFPNGIKMVECK